MRRKELAGYGNHALSRGLQECFGRVHLRRERDPEQATSSRAGNGAARRKCIFQEIQVFVEPAGERTPQREQMRGIGTG
jgi:hypothetical protein